VIVRFAQFLSDVMQRAAYFPRIEIAAGDHTAAIAACPVTVKTQALFALHCYGHPAMACTAGLGQQPRLAMDSGKAGLRARCRMERCVPQAAEDCNACQQNEISVSEHKARAHNRVVFMESDRDGR
jgi:hypothetical protein